MFTRFLLSIIVRGMVAASILPRQTGQGCIPPHCITSGKYAIYNCGTNAATVQTMLDALYPVLVQAVQDLDSGSPSIAYRTFLKDVEFTATASNILAQAAAGARIHPSNILTDGAPVIYCISRRGQLAGSRADTGQKFDAYDACVDPLTQKATGQSGS
ncbi:MAG: hypothetical protein Q9168_006648 [Polycauliona sp. 1 TL-2023]